MRNIEIHEIPNCITVSPDTLLVLNPIPCYNGAIVEKVATDWMRVFNIDSVIVAFQGGNYCNYYKEVR